MAEQKHIVWFSCGAASAVTAMIVVKQIPDCHLIYCDTRSEDEDNHRFLQDIEKWVNKKIEIISSEKYKDVNDVIEKTRFIRGPHGARCTKELKINVRLANTTVNDVNYFGFCRDEEKRIKDWNLRNPKLISEFPLYQYGITKQMCYAILSKAEIELPKMYKMGFNHNNCKCCVKSQSPKYWNLMRKYYPEQFNIRAKQSRDLKFKMVRLKGIDIFLDELPENEYEDTDVDISCDIGCESIYNEIMRRIEETQS